MVGGGFGGCVLAVADADAVQRIDSEVSAAYGKLVGGTPWTHIVAPADAAREVSRP